MRVTLTGQCNFVLEYRYLHWPIEKHNWLRLDRLASKLLYTAWEFFLLGFVSLISFRNGIGIGVVL